MDKSDWQLNERVNVVFDQVVAGAFEEMIGLYNGIGGYIVKIVPDAPVITGIKRHSSVMVKHPDGMEMIVCVYWVERSERLVAENIRLVTLNKTFDIHTVTKEALLKQLKFLCGLELGAHKASSDPPHNVQ